MFERFTEGSRAVLVEAQDIALELGSHYIGVGHILYGCAEGREETAGKPLRDLGITGLFVRHRLPRTDGPSPSAPVDAEALRAIGIDYEGVRAAVDETFGPGALEAAPDRRVFSSSKRKPPFTPEAKRSLQLGASSGRRTAPQEHGAGSSVAGLAPPRQRVCLETAPRLRHHGRCTSGAVLFQLTAAA